MTRPFISLLVLAALQLGSTNLYAKEICKVSMMGRVCFEEGSEQATAAHMKGSATESKVATKESEAKVVAK